ncbi:hypothetical protein M422DRAFT_89750, partial [Sphaerobolus stellatus SS14]
ISRPRNAFMIFRSEFCAQQRMKERGIESDHRQISRIAAHVWNGLSEEQKGPYRRQAKAEQDEHKLRYPEYKYSP